MKRINYLIFSLLAIFIVLSCQKEKPKEIVVDNTPKFDNMAVDPDFLKANTKYKSSYYSELLKVDSLKTMDSTFFNKYLSGFNLPWGINPETSIENTYYYFSLNEHPDFYALTFFNKGEGTADEVSVYVASIAKKDRHFYDVEKVAKKTGDLSKGWFMAKWLSKDTLSISQVLKYQQERDGKTYNAYDSVYNFYVIDNQFNINTMKIGNAKCLGEKDASVSKLIDDYKKVKSIVDMSGNPPENPDAKAGNMTKIKGMFDRKGSDILFEEIFGEDPSFGPFVMQVKKNNIVYINEMRGETKAVVGDFNDRATGIAAKIKPEKLKKLVGKPYFESSDVIVYAEKIVNEADNSTTIKPTIWFVFEENQLIGAYTFKNY